jgi:cytochrome d ubiquinol oxidase subunit I
MLRGRRDRYHRLGFLIPFSVAAALTPIQLFVGDIAAREVFNDQPVKFAAFECVYETGDNQAEHIGGICTDDEVKGAISIPGLDSLLAGFSTSTEVQGLDQFPDDEEPPALTLLHLSFDAMVGIGTALLLLGIWFAYVWWRRRDLPRTPWFLRAAAVAGAAAIVAMWCGWIVTEVGRQPWIVHGYMRTEDAVTPAQGLWWVFGLTMTLYAALGVVAVAVLRGMSRRWREEGAEKVEAPYSPPPVEEGPR